MNPRTAALIKSLQADLEDQRRQIDRLSAGALTADDWLAELAAMGKVQVRHRKLASLVGQRLGLPRGAKARLLAYLRLRKGRVVDKDELSGVSGIHEWARRVRELRVEDGWQISSDQTRDDLQPGQYVLEADTPDVGLRERWRTAHRIRTQSGPGEARILEYFRSNVGRTISKDELQYVARIQEHPRRVRELVEAGWQIESHLDRTDLHPGEYVMVSLAQLPAKAREHVKLRMAVLTDADFKCEGCGHPAGAGRRLQVHHKLPLASGGTDVRANLEALCDACHAGKHATKAEKVVDELLHPELETPVRS
ncbi:MAG TPA: HNH endonuclease [Chloroflexota bacterium]